MSIYDAAMRYQDEGVPLVVLAGKEYGSGSSRDWAAKGPRLLGVRAVIAESYERIHRSNLVGMGVLPLQFAGRGEARRVAGPRRPGDVRRRRGRRGERTTVEVTARKDGGDEVRFEATVRIDTPQEWLYYRHGGILHYVLRQLAGPQRRPSHPLTYCPPSSALTDHGPDRARELLSRERERIENELRALRGDRGDGELSKVDQHTADAGSELFENERDQSVIDRLERELEAIDRAEQRVEEGTYGISVESGEPIPDGRLEAIPWAERTAEEQARFEPAH